MALGDGRDAVGGSSTTNEVAALRRLLTLVNDTITILDVDGRVLWINHDATSGILGYAQHALVGQSPWDYLHPDDVAPLTAQWEELLERPGVSVEAQARLRAADGSFQDVEGTAYNFFDVPGIEGIVLVTRNITRQVMAAELRNDALVDLLDQASDLAILFDPSFNTTFVSDATLTTLETEADGLRSVDDLVAMIVEHDRLRFTDALEAAHRAQDHRLDIAFVAGGERRTLALRIRPQTTREGVGIAVTGTDLTDLGKA